ncbi:hypothetical protein FA13DRAFT_1734055 [Coprinellus micaceus]|uniref:RING-type domain-containing protein n=1 Tax=Coprinellus micaceus TaxID=71717 RepID=A0A4Y7T8E6_COPMI|nr:hypothetical protein FA13DRAFT_1734055 [Coprinellus micaceus]
MEEKDAIVQLNHNNGCRHMFCKKDIIQWLEAENTTCPTCRSGLVDPNAVEEKGHFIIFGGSYRLVEHYERQGMRAKLAPSQTEPEAELDEVYDRLRCL